MDLAVGGAARGRGRSLRAVLERAWALATADERQAVLACRLFRDPFTLDAAAAVAGVTEDVVRRLADSSWLAATEADGAFRCYQVVRDWLADRPIDPRFVDAHARWFGERAAA